jgi:hypothetical protein
LRDSPKIADKSSNSFAITTLDALDERADRSGKLDPDAVSHQRSPYLLALPIKLDAGLCSHARPV